MAIQYLGAGLLAFLAVLVFGKKIIPWLEKHDAVQPLKEEVEQTVYTEEKDSAGEE